MTRQTPRIVGMLGLVMMALTGGARAEQRVWWTEYVPAGSDQRWRMNITGTAKDLVGQLPPDEYLALAAEGQSDRYVFYVYADITSSTIVRASVDGGIGNEIAVETGYIDAMVYDAPSDYLYYALGDTIYRRKFDGSAKALIVDTGADIKRGSLGLARVANYLYYITSGGLYRRSLAGGAPQLLVSAPDLQGLAVAESSDKVYFGEEAPPAIRRINLDGSNAGIVKNLSSEPYLLAVNPGVNLFWAEVGPYAIKRSTIFGSEITTLDSGGVYSALAVEIGPTSCRSNLPFGNVIPDAALNFADINGAVACFQGQATCTHDQFNRADLNPCNSATDTCTGDGIVNFADVSKVVGAFQGFGCP